MLVEQRPEHGDGGKQLAQPHNGGSILHCLAGKALTGGIPAAALIPAEQHVIE